MLESVIIEFIISGHFKTHIIIIINVEEYCRLLSLTPDATNISAFLFASSGVILGIGADSNESINQAMKLTLINDYLCPAM